MARIRTIKPEFWKNEKLGEMPAEIQLLFIGLWNLADRRGFLEYRPKRIKAELFPYRNINIEKAISILSPEFVQIIKVDEVTYLQVVNFEKHQVCNVREQESTVPVQYWHSTSTVLAPGEGKGREGKGTGKEGEGKENVKPEISNGVVYFEKDRKELIELLSQPEAWLISVIQSAKNEGIILSLPEIKRKIPHFLDHVTAQEKWGQSLRSFRAYFDNWIKTKKRQNGEVEQIKQVVKI